MTLDNALDVLKEAAEVANMDPEECGEGIHFIAKTPNQAKVFIEALKSDDKGKDPFPHLSL